ncbi:MAG: copper resistance protein B [Steroidobacteraceae bacterium]|nr:copper resistance protein B [Steroidobacteraceae bacterium]
MKRISSVAALVACAMVFAAEAHAQHSTEHEHSHHDHAQHGQAEPHAAHDPNPAVPTQSEREHIPPDPPSHELGDMSYEDMARMMSMDDTEPVANVVIDQLDWRGGGTDAYAWDAYAWYGTDYNKLWLKAEGERADGVTRESRNELLWDRIFSRWWSVQAGARLDLAQGPTRTWAAVGVQGLAPYFFGIEATAYVGDGGRTAARFAAEYDLLLTQRLILQPELQFNLYGKSDPANAIGSGFSNAELGLRLRYEIRREIAPYVGVLWSRRFGETADLARSAGEDASEVEWAAGLRLRW